MKLDTEERGIVDSFERGEWESVGSRARDHTRYAQYAETTLRKDRRVNIRLSQRDLQAIQKQALIEGLPYQTLISSLLHRYIAGGLLDASILPQPRTVDQQLRFAIANKRLIEITYRGIVRIAEPYDYGMMRNGAALRMYQIRATGSSKGKSAEGWKLLEVSRIEALAVLPNTFIGDRQQSAPEFVLVNEMCSDKR
jgi:predicted DNA binding CopG/RHH family protein